MMDQDKLHIHLYYIFQINGMDGNFGWQTRIPGLIYENPSILVSNDGIKWQEPENFNNPIDEVSQSENRNKYHFSDAALVYNDKSYQLECWYRYSKNGVLDQIYRRKTNNGKDWQPKEILFDHQNCKPNRMLMSPSIIWKNNKYMLWSVSAEPFRVEYRESIDAIN